MTPADARRGGTVATASTCDAAALRAAFEVAVDAVRSGTRGAQYWSLSFDGEASEFIRINGGRLRQAGVVLRCDATLRAVIDGRQALHRVTLSGQADVDRGRLGEAMGALRQMAGTLPLDPHLLCPQGEPVSDARGAGAAGAPGAHQLAALLLAEAGSCDLVGFVSSGAVARGFAATDGAWHWFDTDGAVADFSVHLPSGRAVKRSLAGQALAGGALARELERCRLELEWLQRPEVTVEPGSYRALLEPAALAEAIGMMGWGGFSLRAQRAGQSPLASLYAGNAGFAAQVGIREAPAELQAPLFQSEGFARPASLSLIAAGRAQASLVCPRSARQFGVGHNGAEPSEAPVALALDAGELAADEALAALDTGLWIGNLWYLNWSERASARLTGTTRFGSFWVRDGVVVGPLARARFDDSLYRMLGDALEALGDRPRQFVDPTAYDRRETGGTAAPSALLGSLRIAL